MTPGMWKRRKDRADFTGVSGHSSQGLVAQGLVQGLVLPEGVDEVVCDPSVREMSQDELCAIVVGNRLLILPVAASLLDERIRRVEPHPSVWAQLGISAATIDLTEPDAAPKQPAPKEPVPTEPASTESAPREPVLTSLGLRQLATVDIETLVVNITDDHSSNSVAAARPLRSGRTSLLAAVELSGVVCSFDANVAASAAPVQQTLRADLQVAAGEFVAIVGAAKLSARLLFALMVGVETPDTGVVLHSGVPIALRTPDRQRFNAALPGVLSFEVSAVPGLSAKAEEFVAYPMLAFDVSSGRARAQSERVLTEIGASRLIGQAMATLSPTDRRLAAAGRALACPWSTRFLFDPVANLASETATLLRAAIGARVAAGAAVVVLTDDAELLHMADRVITVSVGSLYEAVRR